MSDRNLIDHESALREGFAALDAPCASAEFDTRVLAAIRPIPWWIAMRRQLSPALASGGCAFVLMLALIRWSASDVAGAAQSREPASRAEIAVDRALDLPNLRAGSLAALVPFRVPAETRPVKPTTKPAPANSTSHSNSNSVVWLHPQLGA